MTRTRLCQNLRNLLIPLWLFALSPIAHAQTLMPMPASSPSAPPEEETIVPTFETQKLARTFMLDIPAPRGQITDRNGVPLAQNRLSYNLVITFPTPLNFSDSQALSYTREKIDEAGKLIGRRSEFPMRRSCVITATGVSCRLRWRPILRRRNTKESRISCRRNDGATCLCPDLSERKGCRADCWLHRKNGPKSGRNCR